MSFFENYFLLTNRNQSIFVDHEKAHHCKANWFTWGSKQKYGHLQNDKLCKMNLSNLANHTGEFINKGEEPIKMKVNLTGNASHNRWAICKLYPDGLYLSAIR